MDDMKRLAQKWRDCKFWDCWENKHRGKGKSKRIAVRGARRIIRFRDRLALREGA